MLLHYIEGTNELARCYITSINDDTLLYKLETLDKILEEYNEKLGETPNKVWHSKNCSTLAFYEPYLYSCVRRQHDGQINVYLCLNIKVCNKLITIMCAPTVAGQSIAYGLYLDGVLDNQPSTIVQAYLDNYCREDNLSQLSDDRHYNPWGDLTFIQGEVNLDGEDYLINAQEDISLCKPSEDYIFNYVYIQDRYTYVLPPKGSNILENLVKPIEVPNFAGSTPEINVCVQTSGVTESYDQLGRSPNVTTDELEMLLGFNPSAYNSVRTEVLSFMDELENEGLIVRDLPDASILDELN